METPEKTAPLLPGETLAGKYKIERILGQGGMGVVVAARHLDLDERVAIKFLLSEAANLPASAPAVERFLREARAAAKVKSEHVCRVHDFGRLESGQPYIVMEYLDGIDLSEKLESEGPQPVDLVATWVIEACDALAEAHAAGIVHRDLKPANLFLARRSNGTSSTRVLDFGISKLPSETIAEVARVGGGGGGQQRSAGSMTQSATMLGSPLYMSPEQITSSRHVDVRADVWSLGVVLYELVSGRHPFEAESMMQLAFRLRDEPATPLSSFRSDIPKAFEAIVMRCLEKKPDDRYASVAALAADLAPLASPDAAALAMRLTPSSSRARISSPDFSIGATTPHGPTVVGDTPVSVRHQLATATPPNRTPPQTTLDEEPIPLGRFGARAASQKTFAPLNTTMGGDGAVDNNTIPSPSLSSRKYVRAIGITGVAVALALLGLAVKHSGASTSQATQATQATHETTTSALVVPSSATVLVSATTTPTTTTTTTTTPTPPTSTHAEEASSQTSSSSTAPTSAPIKKARLAPAVTAIATASAASATVAPASTPSATTPPTKKKRTLDRDDPY